MATSGEMWFQILVALFIFVVVILLIINIITYSTIMSGNAGTIDTSFATMMFWFELILIIIGVALFIWVLILLLFRRPKVVVATGTTAVGATTVRPSTLPQTTAVVPVDLAATSTVYPGQVVLPTEPSGYVNQPQFARVVGNFVTLSQ